jgi:chorismate dehydratase
MNVTAVSYLNTKPFLYGIVQSGLHAEINLRLDIPSVCAAKLLSGEADMGLVPVAVVPLLDNPYIISDYCIGAAGKVRTVAIFGDVPLHEMTHIYMDHHSRTSVELARLLLAEYWQLSPVLLPAHEGYEKEIGGTVGALVIGDRAIEVEGRHAYAYDLAEAWHAHTGLPFVFAAWVSNRPLEADFLQRFNAALRTGIDSLPELMYILPPPRSSFDLYDYYTTNISYAFDQRKKQALALFLHKIGKQVQPNVRHSLMSV